LVLAGRAPKAGSVCHLARHERRQVPMSFKSPRWQSALDHAKANLSEAGATQHLSRAGWHRPQVGDNFASAAGSADAVDDENECDGVEHPARMTTARRPKVAEGAKQVGAADEQARRQPCLLPE
jgi:hypothetical protein